MVVFIYNLLCCFIFVLQQVGISTQGDVLFEDELIKLSEMNFPQDTDLKGYSIYHQVTDRVDNVTKYMNKEHEDKFFINNKMDAWKRVVVLEKSEDGLSDRQAYVVFRQTFRNPKHYTGHIAYIREDQGENIVEWDVLRYEKDPPEQIFAAAFTPKEFGFSSIGSEITLIECPNKSQSDCKPNVEPEENASTTSIPPLMQNEVESEPSVEQKVTTSVPIVAQANAEAHKKPKSQNGRSSHTSHHSRHEKQKLYFHDEDTMKKPMRSRPEDYDDYVTIRDTKFDEDSEDLQSRNKRSKRSPIIEDEIVDNLLDQTEPAEEESSIVITNHPLFEDKSKPYTGILDCEYNNISLSDLKSYKQDMRDKLVAFFLTTLRAQCLKKMPENTLNLFHDDLVTVGEDMRVTLNTRHELLKLKVLNKEEWSSVISAIYLSIYSQAFLDQTERMSQGFEINLSPDNEKISHSVSTLTLFIQKGIELINLNSNELENNVYKIVKSYVATINERYRHAMKEAEYMKKECTDCFREESINLQDRIQLKAIKEFVLFGQTSSFGKTGKDLEDAFHKFYTDRLPIITNRIV